MLVFKILVIIKVKYGISKKIVEAFTKNLLISFLLVDAKHRRIIATIFLIYEMRSKQVF